MRTKHQILTIATAFLFLAGCGQPEATDPSWPDDEYAVVKRAQKETLETGPMPIDKAMTEIATRGRGEFPTILARPSDDLSAVNGWSFQGDVAVAAGDVTMPPECEGAPDPMACWGEQLVGAKGCVACHAVDGVRQQPCPNWKGLYMKERLLVSGETVVANDEYLANSIVNSWDQIVEGYGKVMPPYSLPDEEVQALVAYLKSLGSGS